MLDSRERVRREVENARDELIELAAELVRFPTVNPPGEGYWECAEAIGRRLAGDGFEVVYIEPEEQPSGKHPRVNVIGARAGAPEGRCVHLNGHFDVVPVGEGWTLDPFAAELRNGRLYGRGSADMKCGLASAILAAEVLKRAEAPTRGALEVSATVDEESGGFAGMAELARRGLVSAPRVDHVIIPEPFDPGRICVGHRGVYWCKVKAQGHIAHGCMPFLGSSAVDPIGRLLERVRLELRPAIAETRTEVPIVPPEARQGSINVNAVVGGQAGDDFQTPCVVDRCEVVFDRRFLTEEGYERARNQIEELVAEVAAEDPAWQLEIEELMTVHPTATPPDDPLVVALRKNVREVLGREAELVASPGTYDHKHVTQIGGVTSCVAYGPGHVEQAHQPDEWCGIDDMLRATEVMALTLLDLLG